MSAYDENTDMESVDIENIEMLKDGVVGLHRQQGARVRDWKS